MFFFAAQEWVNFFQVATNTATVPTEAMRRGDFSQLLGPNPFYSTPQVIRDPLTGQPFPGNIIPANRLSPNGIALMKLYPVPTPGYQQGTANLILTSENPQDQRKDNIRLDYRLNKSNQITCPLLAAELGGHRRLPRHVPVRAHRLGSSQHRR